LRSKKGNNEQEEKTTFTLHAATHEAPPADSDAHRACKVD
jgi:hypothetical protein